MQAGDSALRNELRREAASVRVPEDMWGNISHRLDAELAAANRRRHLVNRFQGTSGLALVAVAGICGLMLLPVSQPAGHLPAPEQTVTYANSTDERDLSARSYMKYRREQMRQQASQPPVHETVPVALAFSNISVPN